MIRLIPFVNLNLNILKTHACPASISVEVNINLSLDVIRIAKNRGIQNPRKWLKNPDCVQANKSRDLLIPLQEDSTTEIAGKELAEEENKSKAKQNLYIEEKREINLEAVKELGECNVLNEAMPQGNKCGKR